MLQPAPLPSQHPIAPLTCPSDSDQPECFSLRHLGLEAHEDGGSTSLGTVCRWLSIHSPETKHGLSLELIWLHLPASGPWLISLILVPEILLGQCPNTYKIFCCLIDSGSFLLLFIFLEGLSGGQQTDLPPH